MITSAKQAVAIVTEGKADMVALARAFLDNPHWGWHAAKRCLPMSPVRCNTSGPRQSYGRPRLCALTTEEAGAAVQGARRVARLSCRSRDKVRDVSADRCGVSRSRSSRRRPPLAKSAPSIEQVSSTPRPRTTCCSPIRLHSQRIPPQGRPPSQLRPRWRCTAPRGGR